MSYKRRSLSPDSPWAAAAAALSIIAFCLRAAGLVFSFETLGIFTIVCDYLLPSVCCVILALMLTRRRGSLIRTILPAILIFASFSFGTVGYGPAVCAVCSVFYAYSAVVYVLTVTGFFNSKIHLFAVCGVSVMISVFCRMLVFGGSGTGWLLAELSIIAASLAFGAETRGMRRGRQY